MPAARGEYKAVQSAGDTTVLAMIGVRSFLHGGPAVLQASALAGGRMLVTKESCVALDDEGGAEEIDGSKSQEKCTVKQAIEYVTHAMPLPKAIP